MPFPVDGNSYLHLKLLKALWGQLLSGKLTAAAVPWHFLLECQCRAAPVGVLVLGSAAVVTPCWHPHPFPSPFPRGTSHLCFSQETIWLPNGRKMLLLLPPIRPEIQFSQSSPTSPEPTCCFSCKDEVGQEQGNLSFLSFKTAELPFSQQHP